MHIDIFTSQGKIFDRVSHGSECWKSVAVQEDSQTYYPYGNNARFIVLTRSAISLLAKGKCIEILNIDIEKSELPYENGFFDHIILVNVLEHMIEPKQVLMNLKRYLSENGSIIYSVPNIVNWHSRMMIFRVNSNMRTGLFLTGTICGSLTLIQVETWLLVQDIILCGWM